MAESIGLICMLLGVGLIKAYFVFPPASSQDVAAWVQAVGSIGAIVSAIWLFYAQNERAQRAMRDAEEAQRKRADDAERIETLHMLRSIRDEINLTVTTFDATSGQNIKNGKPGTPHLWTIPLDSSQFPVYHAHVGRLGMVHDDVLRCRIIFAYGMADSFINTLRYNNSLIDKFKHARHMMNVMRDIPHEAAFTEATQSVTAYGDQVRLSYQKALGAVDLLMPSLETEIVRLQNQ